MVASTSDTTTTTNLLVVDNVKHNLEEGTDGAVMTDIVCLSIRALQLRITTDSNHVTRPVGGVFVPLETTVSLTVSNRRVHLLIHFCVPVDCQYFALYTYHTVLYTVCAAATRQRSPYHGTEERKSSGATCVYNIFKMRERCDKGSKNSLSISHEDNGRTKTGNLLVFFGH